MTCLCSAKLTALAELLASLEAPAIGIPGPLAELSAMMSAALSAQMSAGASLGLSAAAMAQLSAMAQATACAQAGLGINLAGPNAQAELDLAITLANANAAAFAPFGALDPAPWLSLSALAALSLKLQLGFGVGLLSAGAFAALSAALSAGASLSASFLASANASASLSAMASAMGVADLSAGGGMAELEAKLSLVASLTMPTLEISLGLLLPPLAILSAIVNLQLAFGVNALAPGFPDNLLAMTADLSAFAELDLSADLAAELAASAEASLDLSASASADASALASLQGPDLSGLTLLASLSASCNLGGFAIGLSSPCGAICPMTSLSIG
jgi:hypothetical protein